MALNLPIGPGKFWTDAKAAIETWAAGVDTKLAQSGTSGTVGVPVFSSQTEAQAYEAENPGKVALWFDGGTTDSPVTATAPTFTDAPGTASDAYTIPAKTGVVYKVAGVTKAAGTYPGTGTVTVTAEAASGYTLTGTASWSHTFSAASSDTTAPSGASLAVTGSGSTRTLTVSGATDSGSGLHAQPYSFSTDGGVTWSGWQAAASFTTAALAAGTYQPRARVRDASSNTATVSAADFTITAAPAAPAVVQTNTADSNGRVVTALTIPQAPTAGHLLVAMIGFDKDFPAESTPEDFVPNGWNLAGMVNNPGDCSSVIIWRVAAGNETAVAWDRTYVSPASGNGHVTLFAEYDVTVTGMVGWGSAVPENTATPSMSFTPTSAPKIEVAFVSTDTVRTEGADAYAASWAAPFEATVKRVHPSAEPGPTGAAIAHHVTTSTASVTAAPNGMPVDGHTLAVGAWA